MAHLVKCKYCGQQFNRDSEPCVQIGSRRYAHKECAEKYEENKTQEEQDIEALEQYIKQLFKEPYINPRVQKQIKQYHEEYQYTYSGMLKTLIYWFEIKGNSIDKSNGGIGIIPFIYKEASQYYYTLYVAKTSNENKDLQQYRPKPKNVVIPSPKREKKQKLFFGEEI